MIEIKEKARRIDFAAGFLTAIVIDEERKQKIMKELDAELGEVLAYFMENKIMEIRLPVGVGQ